MPEDDDDEILPELNEEAEEPDSEEEAALHVEEPGKRADKAPQAIPRPARQLFDDEEPDKPRPDEHEPDLMEILETQHYAFDDDREEA